MKVMSFNLCCWGNDENSVENRAPRVAATIRKYSPIYSVYRRQLLIGWHI